MSCHIYTCTDIKALGVISHLGKNDRARRLRSADVFLCQCVKQYSCPECSAQEVAAIHFLFSWKSHLQGGLPRVLPHIRTGAQIYGRAKHTRTHTQHKKNTQSISVCHVLSPEPTVNTNSLFSAQHCLGGFFFVCVRVCALLISRHHY